MTKNLLKLPEIKVEFRGSAAVVTINRADKRNAMSHEMFM